MGAEVNHPQHIGDKATTSTRVLPAMVESRIVTPRSTLSFPGLRIMTGTRSWLALAGLCTTACMTTANIQHLPLSEGTARPFAADFDSLLAAGKQALDEEGLRLAAEIPIGDSLLLMTAENRFSLFGNGSVVRLMFERKHPAHEVRILTRRQDAFNLTAESDYSGSIFHRISMALTPFPPGAFLVTENTPVRLRLADGTRAGRFLRGDGDSIVFAGDTGAVSVYPTSAVHRLEMPLDPSRRRAERAAWMTVSNIAAGAAAVVWLMNNDCGTCDASDMLLPAVGIPILGIALGRGASSVTGKRWVPARRVPPSASPPVLDRDSTSPPSRADAAGHP